MANKHIKGCSTSMGIMECPLKSYCDILSYCLAEQSSGSLKKPSEVSKYMEPTKLSYTAGRNIIDTATLGNNLALPCKVENVNFL